MMNKTHDGIKVYTPLTLKLYDWWVLRISNQYAWKCSTERYLIPHFRNNMKSNHLDVGVGTGFYLKTIPDICNVSLMDLNTSSLSAASRRAGKGNIIASIQHDVFNPYPTHLHNRFDSLSMFYLLHCLPGEMQDKAVVIRHAAAALTKAGCLYGATILGDDVNHNAFGRKLMAVYNKKGIFSNRNDTVENLRSILSDAFHEVEITVEGKIALFKAERKRANPELVD